MFVYTKQVWKSYPLEIQLFAEGFYDGFFLEGDKYEYDSDYFPRISFFGNSNFDFACLSAKFQSTHKLEVTPIDCDTKIGIICRTNNAPTAEKCAEKSRVSFIFLFKLKNFLLD